MAEAAERPPKRVLMSNNDPNEIKRIETEIDKMQELIDQIEPIDQNINDAFNTLIEAEIPFIMRDKLKTLNGNIINNIDKIFRITDNPIKVLLTNDNIIIGNTSELRDKMRTLTTKRNDYIRKYSRKNIYQLFLSTFLNKINNNYIQCIEDYNFKTTLINTLLENFNILNSQQIINDKNDLIAEFNLLRDNIDGLNSLKINDEDDLMSEIENIKNNYDLSIKIKNKLESNLNLGPIYDRFLVIYDYYEKYTTLKRIYDSIIHNNIDQLILITLTHNITNFNENREVLGYDWEMNLIYKIPTIEEDFVLYQNVYILKRINNAKILFEPLEVIYNNNTQKFNVDIIEMTSTYIPNLVAAIPTMNTYISTTEYIAEKRELINNINTIFRNPPSQNIWNSISKYSIATLINEYRRNSAIAFNELLGFFVNSKIRTPAQAIIDTLAINNTERHYLSNFPVTNIGMVLRTERITERGFYLDVRFTDIRDAEMKNINFNTHRENVARLNDQIRRLRNDENNLNLPYHLRQQATHNLRQAQQQLRILPLPNPNHLIENATQYNNALINPQITNFHITIHPAIGNTQSHIRITQGAGQRSYDLLFIHHNNKINIVNKKNISQKLVLEIFSPGVIIFDDVNHVNLIPYRNAIIHFLRGFEKLLTHLSELRNADNLAVPDNYINHPAEIFNLPYNKYLKYKTKYLNLKKLFDKLSIN
jgi:hypothetical protein